MNRKILFKSKRKDNGEWVEGLPGHDINGNITELDVYKKIGDCRIYEIDPDTICQYTGLTDENGEKIWENDIVKFDKGSNYPIVWNEEYCAFGSCYYSDFDHLSKYKNTEMEVVGNIFDNPDLLEVE